jgi:hypothetical protein
MSGPTFVRLALAAGALIVASGASAQDGVMFKDLLGSIGIIPKEKPDIVYRERPPLVLPPKADLRPPVAPSSVEARAGNWPKDPDVMAARKAAAEEATPETQRESYRLNEGKRLSIEEMRAGRRAGGQPVEPPVSDRKLDSSRLTPDELRLPKDEVSKLGPEGLKRRYLSDPPQALLNPAAGALVKATHDPKSLADPDSPYAFQRQQRGQ